MHVPFLTISFALLERSWYILFYVQSAFADVSFHSGLHTYAGVGENLHNFLYPGMTAVTFYSSVVGLHLVVKLFCQRMECWYI